MRVIDGQFAGAALSPLNLAAAAWALARVFAAENFDLVHFFAARSIALGALVIKIGGLALGVALLETAVAKLRLFRVPELLSGSFTLALLAVVSYFFVR